MSDWTREIWEVTNQSQLDHSINHCTLATVITYKPSADLYGTFYVHQRITDTQEGYEEGKQRIVRMVATHNALAGFPNPEADVRELVEALEDIRRDTQLLLDGWTIRNPSPDSHLPKMIAQINDAVGRLRREP